MTPAARIQAAIEILNGLERTAEPADRFLREWFRARRYAGAKDRGAVAERVYDVLRHRASFAWRMGGSEARLALIAGLLAEGASPANIAHMFCGGGYGPKPLSAIELHVINAPPEGKPPLHVRGEFPAWLEPELVRVFGTDLLDEMAALNARARVDLRVNTLRSSRQSMLIGLGALGVRAEPAPFSPYGIRIPAADGLSALQHTHFFQTGAFEFQDEASQIAALLCAAKPGQRVLDLAAGTGGKSLALAAIMDNKGEILAFDPDTRRLKEIGPRARRAGASIIAATDMRGGPKWGKGKFDVVLVDAPCSGSGTWRRSPELKWRLTSARLSELVQLQSFLLDDGARHVAAGGRLVYATCSLFATENEDVVAAFLARRPEFRIVPAETVWRSAVAVEPPRGMGEYFRASPYKSGTDGFFVCIMTPS